MRIKVTHETIYAYSSAPNHLIQVLRLTPRGHDGQYVSRWRLDIDAECRLIKDEDSFGNITHAFSVDRPGIGMHVIAEGEIETEETNGLVRGAVERLPKEFYLRSTDRTHADLALTEFATDLSEEAARDPLAALHHLMGRIHQTMRFVIAATTAATSAREAFAAHHGVCQDFAQVFIAVARRLNMPARFVGGYLLRDDGQLEQDAGHAWAEAYLPDLGWVGFDPANGVCVTENYVRVATGLDSLDATPVRGVRRGGGSEIMTVKVTVEPAQTRPATTIHIPSQFSLVQKQS